MDEETIECTADLERTLNRITFRPSCVDMGWRWEIKPIAEVIPLDAGGRPAGWLLRTCFRRPDTNTGVYGFGYGRWEFIERGTSVSGAIKTCWLLAELVVRHELMEAFCVDDKRLFDPHKTIEQLTAFPRLP